MLVIREHPQPVQWMCSRCRSTDFRKFRRRLVWNAYGIGFLIAVNFNYSVFGLFLRCNLAIPLLTPANLEESPALLESSLDHAVAIHLNASPRRDPAISPNRKN